MNKDQKLLLIVSTHYSYFNLAGWHCYIFSKSQMAWWNKLNCLSLARFSHGIYIMFK